MDEKMTKLLNVVRETKSALYAEWEKNGYFEDFNNFSNAGKGILAEAMGLTSTMLLYVGFSQERDVYKSGKDDPKTLEIIRNSLEYIYQTVHTEGYTVAPLRDAEETRGVIDKEHAYVDTLTWVLSSSVLVVYAIRQDILSQDPKLENMAIELIADALAHMISGQLPSGAWGFSTHHDAKESLYFTYAVAASMADFLDYIFGELEYYSNEENQAKPATDFYDWQSVNAINNYYKEHAGVAIYPKVDVTEAVNAVKSKLQMWLLTNCLPLLPKIADCVPLLPEEMARIGMTRQTQNVEELGGKDYINLYYAFYIIDILTTSSSDKRYAAIMSGTDKDISADMLKQAYQKVMTETEYGYFFERNSGAGSLTMFDEYINQAIHSARTNFSKAMRSGRAFWDSGKSELTIEWSAKGEYFSKQKISDARGYDNASLFTEPALVPMALRANTVYCFYIIGRSDVTVDNLFDLICEDRSDKTETVRRNTRVMHLWDKTNYSLPVTERAIEALLDYSDYLAQTADNTVKSVEEIFPVSIDDAIDKKIEKFLVSDEGSRILESKGYVRAGTEPAQDPLDMEKISELIEKKVNERVESTLAKLTVAPEKPAATREKSAYEMFDADMYVSELENVQRFLETHHGLPKRDSTDYCERLAYAFLETYKCIGKKALLERIQEVSDDEATGQRKYDELSYNLQAFISTVIENDQLNELLELLNKHSVTPQGNIAGIYRTLISR